MSDEPSAKKQKTEGGEEYIPKNILLTGGAGKLRLSAKGTLYGTPDIFVRDK